MIRTVRQVWNQEYLINSDSINELSVYVEDAAGNRSNITTYEIKADFIALIRLQQQQMVQVCRFIWMLQKEYLPCIFKEQHQHERSGAIWNQ